MLSKANILSPARLSDMILASAPVLYSPSLLPIDSVIHSVILYFFINQVLCHTDVKLAVKAKKRVEVSECERKKSVCVWH